MAEGARRECVRRHAARRCEHPKGQNRRPWQGVKPIPTIGFEGEAGSRIFPGGIAAGRRNICSRKYHAQPDRPPTEHRSPVTAILCDDLRIFELGTVAAVIGLWRPDMGTGWCRGADSALEAGPLWAHDGLSIVPDRGRGPLNDADIMVVPGRKGAGAAPPEPPTQRLCAAQARGARLVSICSGGLCSGGNRPAGRGGRGHTLALRRRVARTFSEGPRRRPLALSKSQRDLRIRRKCCGHRPSGQDREAGFRRGSDQLGSLPSGCPRVPHRRTGPAPRASRANPWGRPDCPPPRHTGCGSCPRAPRHPIDRKGLPGAVVRRATARFRRPPPAPSTGRRGPSAIPRPRRTKRRPTGPVLRSAGPGPSVAP